MPKKAESYLTRVLRRCGYVPAVELTQAVEAHARQLEQVERELRHKTRDLAHESVARTLVKEQLDYLRQRELTQQLNASKLQAATNRIDAAVARLHELMENTWPACLTEAGCAAEHV